MSLNWVTNGGTQPILSDLSLSLYAAVEVMISEATGSRPSGNYLFSLIPRPFELRRKKDLADIVCTCAGFSMAASRILIVTYLMALTYVQVHGS